MANPHTAAHRERVYIDAQEALWTVNLPANPRHGDNVGIFDKGPGGRKETVINGNGKNLWIGPLATPSVASISFPLDARGVTFVFNSGDDHWHAMSTLTDLVPEWGLDIYDDDGTQPIFGTNTHIPLVQANSDPSGRWNVVGGDLVAAVDMPIVGLVANVLVDLTATGNNRDCEAEVSFNHVLATGSSLVIPGRFPFATPRSGSWQATLRVSAVYTGVATGDTVRLVGNDVQGNMVIGCSGAIVTCDPSPMVILQ